MHTISQFMLIERKIMRKFNLVSFGFILMILKPARDHVFATLHKSSYSNLERLQELQLIQFDQLSNPIKDETDPDIVQYYECLRRKRKRLQLMDFGPEYIFTIEGMDINLQCGECIPKGKGYSVSWTKLTFENFQTEVKLIGGTEEDMDLTITSPTADLSSYYCSWIYNKIEMLVNIWTVEIVPATSLLKIPVRNWTNPRVNPSAGLTIGTHFDSWSECNNCGTVGKRHRISYCLVKAENYKLDESLSEEWQAFQVYKSISCSLFLNLHPEIGGINQKLTQALARKPHIAVGFCKVPCDFFETDPKTAFESIYPASIRRMYGARISDIQLLFIDGFSEADDQKYETLKLSNLKSFITGFKNVPVALEYIPEILALISLVVLQTFIMYQICLNRRKAK